MADDHLYTIGHSNRSLDDLLELLEEVGIGRVADIRRYPSSRKFPHFNRQALARSLAGRGIDYQWYEVLGGRRHGGADSSSPNAGLQNAAFRNYADHMRTEEFAQTIEELLQAARTRRTAIMCAEAVFWRCHRRLVSDFLAARGASVSHVLGPGQVRPHTLTAGARVCDDGTVVYPASAGSPASEEEP